MHVHIICTRNCVLYICSHKNTRGKVKYSTVHKAETPTHRTQPLSGQQSSLSFFLCFLFSFFFTMERTKKNIKTKKERKKKRKEILSTEKFFKKFQLETFYFFFFSFWQ